MNKKHLMRLAIFILLGLGIGLFVLSTNNQTTNAAPQSATVINLPGGPISLSGVATADFNGDGYKEIVAAGGDAMLYVLGTNDGTNWNLLWSKLTTDDILSHCPSSDPELCPPNPQRYNKIESTPAIADLDGDGHLDIVVTVGGDVHLDISHRGNGGVLVYRYNNSENGWNFSLNEALSADKSRGWPQPRIDEVGANAGYSDPDGLWDGIRTSPVLVDLDGDGDLEIAVEGIDRRIHAWHHTGEIVSGWPIYQLNGDSLFRGGLSSPAAGDLDNNGLPEVVVGTMSPPDQSNYQLGTIWALNGDSSSTSGFPIAVEQYIYSSPALADLDNDGTLEIVSSSGRGTTGATNKVYIWNHDGTSFSTNWPQLTDGLTIAPPAIGDIDGDDELEIVVGCGGVVVEQTCNKLYAWNADGSLVPGFPAVIPAPSYITSMPYTPILADIDGDNQVEIVISQMWANTITVVEANGVVSDNTTHRIPSGSWTAAPVVDDIDNDGLLEMIVGGGNGGNAQVYIWQESGSTNGYSPWPMFHHDVLRTGLFPNPPQLGSLSDVTILHQSGDLNPDLAAVQLKNTGGNAFNWTTIESIPEVQLSPTSGTVSQSGTLSVQVDASALPNGWTTLGTVTVSATDGGAAIQNSPQSFAVKVFVGNISKVYLPLLIH